MPKAGKEARNSNSLWRLHCAFDLPSERFSFVEVTDEKGAERLSRTPFAKGDIAIADRGYMHPEALAHVLEQGADFILRTPWRGARWYGKNGNLLASLAGAESSGLLDKSIWVLRKEARPLALRIVAFRKPPKAAEASRAKARAASKRNGDTVSAGTPAAAGWLILVTSLDAKNRRALPLPLAHRDGVQAPKKPDRPVGAAKRRP